MYLSIRYITPLSLSDKAAELYLFMTMTLSSVTFIAIKSMYLLEGTVFAGRTDDRCGVEKSSKFWLAV